MKYKYDKITIIGMGLMGGSLGRILIKNNIAKEVIGCGRNINRLKIALKKGAATSVTIDLEKAVNESQIIIVSLPVMLIPEYVKKILTFVNKNCCITDMGSVKEIIVNEIAKFDKEKLFIGSHPMVGSEKAGIENIKDDLFKGGTCIITPMRNSNHQKIKFLTSFWKDVGMRVIKMTPKQHDKYISGVSHFPHLVSFALINCQKENILKRKEIIGQGFKDATRIAASNEEIWTDIFIANKKNLIKDIDTYLKTLKNLRNLIKKGKVGKIKNEIKNAKKLRGQIQ
jgi:prephenate dehydrogenase